MHVIFPKINILYFKSDSNNVVKGNNCVISWTATNVTRVEIKGKSFSPVGSIEYTPDSSETITAVFMGDDGSTERRSIKIRVTEPKPKNNHGCLMSILFLFVIVVAFIAWAYFFRHDIYNDIIYTLNNNISNILNSINK